MNQLSHLPMIIRIVRETTDFETCGIPPAKTGDRLLERINSLLEAIRTPD